MQVDIQAKSPQQVIVELERAFGLSRDDMARALDVNVRTVERWRKGTAIPQREARARLAVLLALRDRLHGTFSTEDMAREWLHRPNRYVRGLTPADALRVGRPDRVDGALEKRDLSMAAGHVEHVGVRAQVRQVGSLAIPGAQPGAPRVVVPRLERGEPVVPLRCMRLQRHVVAAISLPRPPHDERLTFAANSDVSAGPGDAGVVAVAVA
jgi:uncharacterized protein (DUF2384 family)